MPYFDEPIGRIKIQTTSIDITECRLKSSDVKRHTVKDRGTIFCLFVIFLRRASWLIQTFTVLQAVQAWAWTKKSALEGRLQWDLFWEEKEFHFVLWKLCGRRQRYHPITFLFYFKTSKVLTNVNVYLAPSIFQASSQLVTHSSPQSFDQSVSQSVSETVRQSDSQSVSQSVIGLDEGHTLEMLA